MMWDVCSQKAPLCIDQRTGLKQNRSQFSNKWGKNKPTEEWQRGAIFQTRWRKRGWVLWCGRWRKRDDIERDGERVRQGDVGAVYPSSAWPGATWGVKLLTSVWTAVSGWEEVHQGNETPGLYCGPRCTMGGQRETFGGNRLSTIEKKRKKNSRVVFMSLLAFVFS